MKVTPEIKEDSRFCECGELEYGSAFLYKGDLWMMTNGVSQEAVCLSNGALFDDICGEKLIPVEATITWKRKAVKKSKKSTKK